MWCTLTGLCLPLHVPRVVLLVEVGWCLTGLGWCDLGGELMLIVVSINAGLQIERSCSACVTC